MDFLQSNTWIFLFLISNESLDLIWKVYGLGFSKKSIDCKNSLFTKTGILKFLLPLQEWMFKLEHCHMKQQPRTQTLVYFPILHFLLTYLYSQIPSPAPTTLFENKPKMAYSRDLPKMTVWHYGLKLQWYLTGLSWMTFMDDFLGCLSWMTFMDDFLGWPSWMTFMDDCHRLLWTDIMDCHGLSWTVMDCHGLSKTGISS